MLDKCEMSYDITDAVFAVLEEDANINEVLRDKTSINGLERLFDSIQDAVENILEEQGVL